MNKINILYISGLNKKKRKYDGERIKNTYIYKSLIKKYNVTLVNLSSFKFFNTIKMFVCALFNKNKYKYAIISKDPHGANIIHKVLRLAHFPSTKIIYFEIGPFLYDRIKNNSIKFETFSSDRLIVVETESMKSELDSLGFNNVQVFPNFKPVVEINQCKKCYPTEILNLVFLSRVEEKKGIFDLIETISVANASGIKFKLDIYGRIQSNKDFEQLKECLKKYDFIDYKGKMDVGSIESYSTLSSYDLHVFPTKYTEGFPGTIIDFFIAGVPTLSSSFARAHEILSDDNSIIYKQFDNDDLLKKLNYIYQHQDLLSQLRKNSFDNRNKYSVESFERYLEKIL